MDSKQQAATDSVASLASRVGTFSISHSTSARAHAHAGIEGLDFSFAGDRPPTNLGSRQGDHSRAYALIKHLVDRRCGGLPIDEAIKQLLHIASCYLYPNDPDEAQQIISKVSAEFDTDKYFTQADIDALSVCLRQGAATENQVKKAQEGWLIANTRGMERVFEELASHYLTQANQKALTTFPVEFNVAPPEGEAARVTAALKYLDSIDSETIREIDLAEIVQHICHLFWYPRVPDEKLCDLQRSDHVSQWQKIRKKYRAGTQPRDNNLDTLCQVMESYLALIFECYPVLHLQQNEILNDFIELVLEDTAHTSDVKFGWNLDGNEKKAVTKTIVNNLQALYGFYEETKQGSRENKGVRLADVVSQSSPSPQVSDGEDTELDTTFVVDPEKDSSGDSPLGSGNSGDQGAMPVFSLDEEGNRTRKTYEQTLSELSPTPAPRK